MTPQLHFSPARGWLNDPNGLIQYRGRHHLFFQHNPRVLVMQDMEWGHASSTDLVNWVEHPVALLPGPGDYDDDGCWSGCAVATDEGVALIYSGNHHDVQLPCLATSTDPELIGWAKASDNPVVGSRPPVEDITSMRDHSVRWDGEKWCQAVAAGAGGEGMLFGFSSDDLHQWSWDGVILRASQAGLPGFGWECPDVFELDGSAVAIFSVMDDKDRPVVWVTGRFDGPNLIPERSGLVDFGDRVYAPQSYTDENGRRIMFGWIRTQDDPAGAGGASIGVMSVPRRLRVIDGVLRQEPVPELLNCRRQSTIATVTGDHEELEVVGSGAAALEVRIECGPPAALDALVLEFVQAGGRTRRVEFAALSAPAPVSGELGTEQAPVAGSATVLFDAGIVEAFLDDGRAAAWTDLGLETVSSLRIIGSAGGPVTVTQWILAPHSE